MARAIGKSKTARTEAALVAGIKATVSIGGFRNLGEMADSMAVPQSTLYAWIKDPGKISLHNLIRLELVMEANGINWRSFI